MKPRILHGKAFAGIRIIFCEQSRFIMDFCFIKYDYWLNLSFSTNLTFRCRKIYRKVTTQISFD